ncbi:MAG: hypothetical protein WC511_04405 [Candidatus Pacearchaeota archaeon]
MKEKGEKKFVWKSLRISFYVMIATFLISLAEPWIPTWLLYTVSAIWYLSLLFTFIMSIVHLTKYKEKIFAIVALVISSLLILLILMTINYLVATSGAV